MVLCVGISREISAWKAAIRYLSEKLGDFIQENIYKLIYDLSRTCCNIFYYYLLHYRNVGAKQRVNMQRLKVNLAAAVKTFEVVSSTIKRRTAHENTSVSNFLLNYNKSFTL